MNTYYEELIEKVELLINEAKFEEAYQIVAEELELPFIEKKYEDKLIAYYNELKPHVMKANPKSFDEEDIDALLHGSLDEVFLAIEQLRKSNIRNHLDAIQDYLDDSPNFLAKAYLIEAMMEQNVSQTFRVEHEGLMVEFNPCFIEPMMESQGAILVMKYLRDWFENDDPTFLMMCMETLFKEAYLMLPFNIEVEDALQIAIAIVLYVFVANQDGNKIDTWLKEHDLEQEVGWSLLINGYEM